MADKKVLPVPEVEVNETLESAKGIWEKYKNLILGFLAGVVLVGGGYIAYKKLIKEPNEEKAAEVMFKAEQYYGMDSLNLALNGDGTNKGFLYVTNEYGGTKAGNLSHFYAGVIYLRKQDFNSAVKHLKDFDTDAKQVQMIAYGRLADAYSELGKKEDAVEYYKKAAHQFEQDEFNASEFLFRAGYLLETMNKNQEAVDVYKEIKEKYPRTEKGFTIDKYIYRLSIEKNEFSVK